MALRSTGGANYIHFGNNAPMGEASPFSVIVTAYVDTSENDALLVGKRTGFSSGTNLFTVSLGGTRRPAITKNGNFFVWGSPTIAVGAWFTMVVIGSASGAKAFVDGVAAGTNGSNHNLNFDQDWRSGAATSSNLELFTFNAGSATLKGRMSKCIIYDRALSDEEAIYSSKGLPAPIRGRTFTADFLRDARDLTNRWSGTTIGSLTVENNPKTYGIY